MNEEIFQPFYEITKKQMKSYNRELKKEISREHLLKNKKAQCIAKRNDCDEFLFYLPKSNEYAIVHLTWAHEKNPNWPNTKIFINWEDLKTNWDKP